MHQQKLILLDFDGVIVDGINEYWNSSLIANQKYLLPNWENLVLPKNLDLFKTFVEIRPWVKYGWEMVLITHEILKRNNPLNSDNKDKFVENYEKNCSQILIENGWDSKTLQKYLDEARKFQIENNLKRWIKLHHPYEEVLDFIKQSQQKGYHIGIISTKGKIFTAEILDNINIYPNLIFGYESGNKVSIISDLIQKYDIKGFIEDRRQTLMNIISNNQTNNIKCYLAEWGYLKKTDKENLPQKIRLLKIKKLEDILAN